MIKVYHAPLTRSVRVLWLLEELAIPHVVEKVEFRAPTVAFEQKSPFGKLPAIEDGDITMFESGAIVEYLLERYGDGRLAPPGDSPLRGPFLQWIHFAEATAFPSLGQLAWHVTFKQDADRFPEIVEQHRAWAAAALRVVEAALEKNDHLLGSEFTAADIMVGMTLLSAKYYGVLDDRFPRTGAYLTRLLTRPAWRKALAT